eukprot:TRINITY_DN6598_c0_g1_i1.p1 TRINITY_DN6598_c0_g1~~TRINITY_DN6598_c0_g1_i1.p1  ORF type:complete len:618 (+),score=80.77 TRINITY_DN6598_c0_g1_i1:33-1856(+)
MLRRLLPVPSRSFVSRPIRLCHTARFSAAIARLRATDEEDTFSDGVRATTDALRDTLERRAPMFDVARDIENLREALAVNKSAASLPTEAVRSLLDAAEPILVDPQGAAAALRLGWQCLAPATAHITRPAWGPTAPEATFYAANQMQFFRTALRLYGPAEWAAAVPFDTPPGPIASLEEMMFLTRRDILFRSALLELDPVVLETAVTLCHQAVAMQGMLVVAPHEERLVRMIISRVDELLNEKRETWEDAPAAELGVCLLKLAMFVPLSEAFDTDALGRALAVPFPAALRRALDSVAARQYKEVATEAALLYGKSRDERRLRPASCLQRGDTAGSAAWVVPPNLVALPKTFAENWRALVIATGTGALAAACAARGATLVTATDSSALNLCYLHRQATARGLINPLALRQCDNASHAITELKTIPSCSYNLILCPRLLTEERPEATMGALLGLLSAEGRIALCFRHAQAEKAFDAVRQLIRNEVAAGFGSPLFDANGSLARLPTLKEARVIRTAIAATARFTNPQQDAQLATHSFGPAFYSYSGLVDCVLNPVRRSFSIQDAVIWTQELGLHVEVVQVGAKLYTLPAEAEVEATNGPGADFWLWCARQ